MRFFAIAVAALVVFLGASAWAHSYRQGDIKIGHIWARATPPGATETAVYMPLLNAGKEKDRLVGVSSPAARKVEIHNEAKDLGVTHMEKLDAVELEPGKPVSLRPNGMHLMVYGLKAPLKAGDMMPLTLQFEKAGTANVEAMIEPVGAMSGDEMPMTPGAAMPGMH